MSKRPQGQSETPVRRHLNATQKRALKAAEIRRFVQPYGRRAQRGMEPNDRHFDPEIEKAVQCMSPEDLDRLMQDDKE